jgi:hypothetical protein
MDLNWNVVALSCCSAWLLIAGVIMLGMFGHQYDED